MKWFFLFAVAVVASSCTQKDESASEAVRLAVVGIIESDNKKDLQGVMNSYTNDAVLVPPGKPLIEGHEAIRKNYEGIFAGSSLNLRITIDSLKLLGSDAVAYGYTLGQVTSLIDNSVKDVNDRYIMLLRLEDRRWKITRLMWSPE